MQWRAQAILRVITALRALVPLSHIVLQAPFQDTVLPWAANRAARRQHLIANYGKVTDTHQRIPMCAYCGTTVGRIEVEHIIPESRGGTDVWGNLALACAACNRRKGHRTPEEAGMVLQLPHSADTRLPHRTLPYRYRTAAALYTMLAEHDLATIWYSSAADQQGLPPALAAAWTYFRAPSDQPWPTYLAKPIARPRKQRFTARNYPKETLTGGVYLRVGTAIKRRVRVNRGLLRQTYQRRVTIRVVGVHEPIPEAGGQWITHGMLCEARRAGQKIVGIVAAVHSSGRLTLLVPQRATSTQVWWDRVVVGAQRYLRVLSTDRVIFLPILFQEDR